ncbi:NUDIX domain-containing protein [candidate division WWE3 bacterium]|nr:NUDIX domain-containing protein [candidate division WWE3 bacterium]
MHESVAIALVNTDKILLQHRDNNPQIFSPNVWCLPSGSVEGTETPRECAIRECFEETGYKLKNPIWYACHQELFYGRWIKRFFFVEEYDHVQPIHCYEGQEMRFMPVNKLPSLNLYKNEGNFVKAAINAYYKYDT